MWGGRFSKSMDDAFARLNASFGFDWRLYDADIRGSIAYTRALERAGIIDTGETETLVNGLERVRHEFDNQTFEEKAGDEDIHSAVERRLGELIGPLAGKLHTGRSRNDQVATDMRIFVLDAVRDLQRDLRDVQREIVDQAEAHLHVLMPGYTHLQRAQPILFSHWLLSFFWMLERDHQRLLDCAVRTSILPLGSGALAGNAIGVDRQFLAQELGFAQPSENSLDAVSDRDFVVEFLFDSALLGVHLSRLGEDMVLYSSAEFGFVILDDSYSTGSSLMPQKKNPDSMELARGKSARLIGHLTGLLTLLKGLPSSYDKDLQEDKEPLFDTVDNLQELLPVVAGVIRTMDIDPERMQGALDMSMLATDLADYLVRHGMPFREAHRKAGEAVKLAEARGLALSELSPEDFANIAPEFGSDVGEVFDFERSVGSREIIGGTGPESVRDQIAHARRVLGST